jgi:hypothetical protein
LLYAAIDWLLQRQCFIEKRLTILSQQFQKRNEKGQSLTDAEMGIRVGKILNKYHVAKHFETTIAIRRLHVISEDMPLL